MFDVFCLPCVLWSPDVGEKRLGREGMVGIAGQRLQQTVLGGGQVNGLTRHGHSMLVKIELLVVAGHLLVDFNSCTREHSTHASHQFGKRKGLGHVVVYTQVKTAQLVILFAFGCKHDYGY